MQHKTKPINLSFSPDGKLFAVLSLDRKVVQLVCRHRYKGKSGYVCHSSPLQVRVFHFLTGKLQSVFDESLDIFTQLQQVCWMGWVGFLSMILHHCTSTRILFLCKGFGSKEKLCIVLYSRNVSGCGQALLPSMNTFPIWHIESAKKNNVFQWLVKSDDVVANLHDHTMLFLVSAAVLMVF